MFDLHTLLLIVAVAFLGGMIGLDRTALGQIMISQPIVSGPLTGWILGDLDAGLIIGTVLELIWVLDMPVGTFVPADSTIATIAATAIAVLGSRGKAPLDEIGFGILLTIPLVPITMAADEFIRKRNSRLTEKAVLAAEEKAGEEPDGTLSRAHLSGLAAFFVKSFVLYLLFIPAGLAAVRLFGHLPVKAHEAMALFVKSLPLLGAAMVLRKLSIAAVDRSFLIGFVAAVLLAFFLHGYPVGVILLVLATGFVSARHWGRI